MSERPLSMREQKAQQVAERRLRQDARLKGSMAAAVVGDDELSGIGEQAVAEQVMESPQPLDEGGGEKVDLKGAVAWVARNFEKVVGEDEKGRFKLHWDRASEAPPSDVARSYMRVAASKQVEFFSRIVPRFLGDEADAVVEMEEQDKKLVGQVRAVLKKFVETMPEPVEKVQRRSGRKTAAVKEEHGQSATEAAGS